MNTSTRRYESCPIAEYYRGIAQEAMEIEAEEIEAEAERLRQVEGRSPQREDNEVTEMCADEDEDLIGVGYIIAIALHDLPRITRFVFIGEDPSDSFVVSRDNKFGGWDFFDNEGNRVWYAQDIELRFEVLAFAGKKRYVEARIIH